MLSSPKRQGLPGPVISDPYLNDYPLPSWIIDAENYFILFANQAAITLTGYQAHQQSSKFHELLSQDSTAVSLLLEDLIKTPGSIYSLKKKNGKDISVQFFAAFITRNEKPYFQLTAVPVSHSAEHGNQIHQTFGQGKKYFPEAENSSNRFRFLANLVEQTTDVLTASDLNFRPLTWNQAAEKIYGLKAEEVIGRDLRDFLNISYPGSSRDEVRSTINKQGEWKGEASFVRATDNKTITLLIGFKLLKDEQGFAIGHLISATDISERKEAELRLKESENRFREMADSSPAMIWMTDENNHTTYTNKPWLDFTGMKTMNEAEWESLVHPHDSAKVVADYRRAFENRKQATLIYRLRRFDGSYRWVHDVSVPRFLHDKQFIGYIGTVVDIEEQKQKQEQLLYQATILENVSDIVVTTDTDFKVRVWNKTAEHYYEIAAEEAIGRRMGELVCFTYQDTTTERALYELQREGIWKGEVSVVNSRGEPNYFLHTVKNVYDEKGLKIGYLAVGRDITDMKLADQKLKKSEQFYRTLIADSLDGILLLNEEGKISFSSPSVKNVLGYEVNEILGRNAFDFVHPDDAHWAINSFQKEVVENPEVKFIVVRLLKKDGKWLWCMVRGHNLLKNPNVNSIVVYFHDDTLRKQASEALKESEKRFRTLIKDLHTGVLLQDPEGRILMSNNATTKIFGIEEEALIGNQIWNIYKDAIKEDGTAFLAEEKPSLRAIQTKKMVKDVVMGVWHPQRKEHIWLILCADPILDDEGNLRHIVCSFTDITERKKLERDLLSDQMAHQRQLTQATIDGQEKERKEIGKELHDNIGQQLTTIKLFLDLAKSTADDATNEMVYMALKGISDVINEVRNMSRSLIPSTLKDLGLVESVDELTESISRTEFLRIDFNHFDFDEELLAENQKLTVFRIIQEQLNNIVKHAGAKEAWIEMSNTATGIVLTIRDDGHGFDLKKTRKGLGFMNINNRAELFSGKAEVFSQPGQGCMLRVSLPFPLAGQEVS